MVKVTTTTYDDLVKLAGEFVTSRKGMWDHSAWVFRGNSATDSSVNRPPIPIDFGH